MDMLLNIVYYVVPFIILLGILVFVHEFGHFIVARLLGVKVVAFSIGFGKELWSKTDAKGTVWKISAVPLGGYCQFLGDADASSSTTDKALANLSEEDKKEAFALQKTWKKIAIVVAGPLFNYLFAIFVFIMLFYNFGQVVYPAVVGKVMPNSAAEEAGLQVGDEIISINGHYTADFKALSNEIALSESDEVRIRVNRPMEVVLKAEEVEFDVLGKPKRERIIGLRSKEMTKNENTGKFEEPLAVVGYVIPNSPAAKTEIRPGDIMVSVNGVVLQVFNDLSNYVQAHIDDEFRLKMYRPLVFKAKLRDTKYGAESGANVKRRMLGVQSAQELVSYERLDFRQSIAMGFYEAYDLTAMTLRGVGQMIVGARSGEDVGGIIRIAEMSGDVSKSGGLLSFIYFMALLSVNLGLLNLFPIPVLDGGNLVIYLIEMVYGRELNAKIKDGIFKVGLFLLLALMVFATWNDIVHLIGRWFE